MDNIHIFNVIGNENPTIFGRTYLTFTLGTVTSASAMPHRRRMWFAANKENRRKLGFLFLV